MNGSRRIIPAIVAIALLAACGGDGGDGGVGGDGDSELVTSVDLTPDDEVVAHGLQAGRYRVTVTERCESWGVRITGPTGEPVFEREDPPLKVFLLNDLPAGPYIIEQTVEDCTDWTIRLAKVSG